MTDASMAIINYYLYEPFGKSLYTLEQEDNPFEFVGQLGVRQMGDDLIYMRNRFYAPSTGRFMSEDPIGLAGGDVSFYRYVANDPVNWVDPDGFGGQKVGKTNISGNHPLTDGLGKQSPQSEIDDAIKEVTKELQKPEVKGKTRSFLRAWLKVAKRGFRYKPAFILLLPGQDKMLYNLEYGLPLDSGKCGD